MPSSLLSLLLTLTLLHRPISAASHRKPHFLRPHPNSSSIDVAAAAAAAEPTTYFEVTRPIPLPKTQPHSYLILRHEFAYTYGKPPVFVDYKPPLNPNRFARMVLEWTATSIGRQYDRIFGVWLGGVEILRSCTAEPRATGIVWAVKKDITRYRSLLMSAQTVSVYMGNIVDSTYNGTYHVNLTFHFYPAEENHHHKQSFADLILAISRDPPVNDGFWFEIENSTDSKGKEVEIPRNAYRAVLEIYVSFHENDEFWFGNYPDEYISVNNLTDVPGNGPFREVIVRLDDVIVGAVWPFTVIYTGGVNPLLWRPITGIGSFNLPSYDIEITPFLGGLLDGKAHKFAFSTTNALNVWYINANLHLWLDKKRDKTRGKLLKHTVTPLSSSLVSKINGPNGTFTMNVSRSLVSRGRVESSLGAIITKTCQEFRYSNKMKLRDDGNLQILKQITRLKNTVGMKKSSSAIFSGDIRRKFRVHLYYNSVRLENGSKTHTNVTLGIDESGLNKASGFRASKYTLKNVQNGQGHLVVDGKSIHGLGKTQQSYSYVGDKSCYFRKVRSSNYAIVHDKESTVCKRPVF